MSMSIRRGAAVLALAVLVSCGPSDRDLARDSLIKQLVDGGLSKPVATCVVDRFFAGKTDKELKGFFERPALTDAERAEFTSLGAQCATATSATT